MSFISPLECRCHTQMVSHRRRQQPKRCFVTPFSRIVACGFQKVGTFLAFDKRQQVSSLEPGCISSVEPRLVLPCGEILPLGGQIWNGSWQNVPAPPCVPSTRSKSDLPFKPAQMTGSFVPGTKKIKKNKKNSIPVNFEA